MKLQRPQILQILWRLISLPKKKLTAQGWYGRMTEEQRAEYLLKQREAQQRK
jgi:hypothetical protein